jgi:serine-type D-Ala-D-Ala carboxypeptidase (penicillin-binding protein 5/6)
MNTETHIKILRFLLLLGVIFVFVFEFIFSGYQIEKINRDFVLQEDYNASIKQKFADISLDARAWSVYDFTLGSEIYGKNQKDTLPLASLSKTMVVLTALDFYQKNDEINISNRALSQHGDYNFTLNQKYYFEDLAKFTMISSANDASFALLENVGGGIERMNKKAEVLGFESLKFYNATGLDLSPGQASAFGNALDMNKLNFYAYNKNKEIFSSSALKEITIYDIERNINKTINTNTVLNKIPNILFSKTGFTNTAGGNLSVLFKDTRGHTIGITLLGSTFEGRFSEMVKMVEFTNQQLSI